MPTIHIDLETRSTVELRKTGAHKYAADPATDLWCACYAVDEGPVETWLPGDGVPDAIVRGVSEGWIFMAHNAAFERTIWRHILAPRYGWPEPTLPQWRCTMAMALAMALPASLDRMVKALELGVEKDLEGYRLMLRMAKPRKRRKDEPEGIYWFDDEVRRQRLYAYCRQDVEAERAAEKRLVPLSPQEQQFWQLDQIINDRGIGVDVEMCNAALRVIRQATERLNQKLSFITDGAVEAASEVESLKLWLARKGVSTTSLDKEAIDDLLADQGITGSARGALEIRREAAKGSTAKVKALLNGLDADGRARGLLQFHAASTGRWAGRRFQPQNLKRPSLEDVAGALELLALGEEYLLSVAYGEPLAVVADCLRSLLVAAPGRDLLAADFSNIEGVMLAWLAGETWKLEAFGAYQDGTGPEIYKVAVADLYGKPVEAVTKDERQKIGKVLELASGYEGGHGAYLKFGVDKAFPVLVPTIKTSAQNDYYGTGETEWNKAWDRYDPKRAHGLTQEEWTAVRITIDRWRRRNSNIKQLWRDLDDAAIWAMQHPGKRVTVNGKITFRLNGSFLWARLPSGRLLCYPYPELRTVKTPWGKERLAVTYVGTNSYTRKWERGTAYGGLWAENMVQAISRDVLASAMLRCEAAGYHIVLTVHDEIVSEIPKGRGSIEEFSKLMTELPAWAEGAPAAVAAWRGERYRK